MFLTFQNPFDRPIQSSQYQFVWWGWRSWAFRAVIFDESKTDLAKVYRWSVNFGPFEVRKWACGAGEGP